MYVTHVSMVTHCCRRKKSSSKVPNGFDYSNTVVLQNMHSTDPGLSKCYEYNSCVSLYQLIYSEISDISNNTTGRLCGH